MMNFEDLLFNDKIKEPGIGKDLEKIEDITEDYIKDLLKGKGNGVSFKNDVKHRPAEPLYENIIFDSYKTPFQKSILSNNYTSTVNIRRRNQYREKMPGELEIETKYKNLNPHQIRYILMRKERRKILNKITKKHSKTYIHESRHRHAKQRLRASSGRFLTKEESNEYKKNINK